MPKFGYLPFQSPYAIQENKLLLTYQKTKKLFDIGKRLKMGLLVAIIKNYQKVQENYKLRNTSIGN